MIKRTSNKALPDTAELTQILKSEARREPPPEKVDIHYPRFETVIALLEYYNIESSIFTDSSMDVYQAVEQGKELLDQLVKLLLSDTQPPQNLLNAIYDYLSEEDDPIPSDVIFVFGSKTPLRAQKAAKLYHKGLGKMILVSGGAPVYAENTTSSEAEKYEEILINQGVAQEHIILENKAITLPDNVWRALDYFDKTNQFPTNIILVNSPYSQRRGWALFMKHIPDSTKLYRVNSGAGENYSRANWYKQEDTIRVVLNEMIKMRASVVYNTA